jgi:hypothetical protein
LPEEVETIEIRHHILAYYSILLKYCVNNIAKRPTFGHIFMIIYSIVVHVVHQSKLQVIKSSVVIRTGKAANVFTLACNLIETKIYLSLVFLPPLAECNLIDFVLCGYAFILNGTGKQQKMPIIMDTTKISTLDIQM